ncbi:MAG: four helix bundle protein [Candidatus Cloacimonetes bacterium]|nr:four helix bundle protein [Candidatus Cloacimonadota bacterium]
MTFRFRDFPVYKDARLFRKEIKRLSKKKFPPEEKYALRVQLWRVLDSILLNIAEGSDRYSDQDFSRFLNNAVASTNEVVACLDAAFDDSYLTTEEHRTYTKKAENIVKQLKSFSSKVRKDDKRH